MIVKGSVVLVVLIATENFISDRQLIEIVDKVTIFGGDAVYGGTNSLGVAHQKVDIGQDMNRYPD